MSRSPFFHQNAPLGSTLSSVAVVTPWSSGELGQHLAQHYDVTALQMQTIIKASGSKTLKKKQPFMFKFFVLFKAEVDHTAAPV